MAAVTEAAMSLGHELQQSPIVAQAIEALVREVRTRAAQITDIRPALPGAQAAYQDLLRRAGEARGRPPLYPYVASGLGNGALVELADGSVKWDMICGIGVHFFGHSEPGLIEAAVRAGLDDTVKQGNLQSNFEAHEFCETLLGEARKNSRLRFCYPTTSGAMANENALKVCYQKAMPASRVIAFKDCFMGRSVTMAQIGDAAAYRVGVPLTVGVDYMPFYDPVRAASMGQAKFIEMCVSHLLQYIERYPGQHAAFVFELVQGEGGFNTAPREFFTALMDVCRANHIAVWDDEIQTFGRTTRMFAYESLDLGDYIDVLTVGKMSQACATLYTEEFNPKPGLLSGTFTGETVSFRVGQKVIERLRDGDSYGDAGSHARHHRLFREQVKALASRHPEWFPPVPEIEDIVGGTGGMMRFTPFKGDKTAVPKACRAIFDEGVVLFYCGHGPYHLRLLPPLGVMKDQDWPRVFACIERGLAKAYQAM
ncbi:MAG: aminotransferase class III-fold pyridoxal phosphate-dependent enzyme [Phycisphaerales bacterium]|nr:aminotransferase class III-fold pyridoxal phosphate-dependent enzyme [Phycisphaerales bacterium]